MKYLHIFCKQLTIEVLQVFLLSSRTDARSSLGEEAWSQVLPQGKRLDHMFSLRVGDWITGFPSGEGIWITGSPSGKGTRSQVLPQGWRLDYSFPSEVGTGSHVFPQGRGLDHRFSLRREDWITGPPSGNETGSLVRTGTIMEKSLCLLMILQTRYTRYRIKTL